LASKQAIIASPPATWAIASIRAVCTRSSPRGGEPEQAVVPLPDVVVGPKQRLGCLVGGPGCAVEAAQLLDLVDVLGVLGAGQGVRPVGAELGGAVERERPDPGQAKAEHRAGGVGLPDAGAGRGRVEVGEGGVFVPAVVGAQREHGRGDLLADRDPVRLGRAVGNRREVGGVIAVEDRLLARVEAERGLRLLWHPSLAEGDLGPVHQALMEGLEPPTLRA